MTPLHAEPVLRAPPERPQVQVADDREREQALRVGTGISGQARNLGRTRGSEGDWKPFLRGSMERTDQRSIFHLIDELDLIEQENHSGVLLRAASPRTPPDTAPDLRSFPARSADSGLHSVGVSRPALLGSRPAGLLIAPRGFPMAHHLGDRGGRTSTPPPDPRKLTVTSPS